MAGKVIAKTTQYGLLFLLTIFFSDVLSGESKWHLVPIHFILLYLILFWMSHYPVSFQGMRFINFILSATVMVVALMLYRDITGIEGSGFENKPLIIGILVVAYIFFWKTSIFRWVGRKSSRENVGN